MYHRDMKEDNILLGQAEDKIRQCFERSMPTNTVFLDPHQQSLVRGEFMKQSWGCALEFYGGYEDAEREVLLCLPDYATVATADPLAVISAAVVNPGGRRLKHGDYLGSLTGLGIKREMTGDILVRDDGADIIVLEEIADFIVASYGKAGRVDLHVEKKQISELIVPERQLTRVTDTVASLRLDNIVSSAFGISRTKATQAISQGLVFLNHMEATKSDAKVSEGDRIVLRHKGRADLEEVGGNSRKGRIYVVFQRY
jgi:RNA-binding protein YlmH